LLAIALTPLVSPCSDARNPRTAGRELPSGQLSSVQVVVFCAASLALFLVAVFQLAPKTHYLWPIPVVMFVVYPYLKRFTWLCHLWLGAADGLAPVGAWVAITNHLPWQAWVLGAAVALWVAGFDFFYALFDVDVDRDEGLHSIATRFGVRGAFAAARIAHTATVVCLIGAGLGLDVGVLYWFGVAAVGVLLVYEHALVRPGNLRRLDAAFFTMNGVISVVFAVFVIVDAVT
jgi:4-hydroxybenzoate polyprenyltransferase